MEDGLESLFVPDVLTPSQFADLRRSANGDDAPIKRLMLGLLEISLRDALGARRTKLPSRRRTFVRPPSTRACERVKRAQGASAQAADALAWVFDDGGDGPFAFRSVCEVLEIDPGRLRERLAERRVAERQAA